MFPHKQKSALVKKEMRCLSVAGGTGFLMPMDYGACTLAGDQTRGGKAPARRATAGECRHAKRGSH
ncbi:hypothetical protein ACNKHT_22915 [Shigella flexneri]